MKRAFRIITAAAMALSTAAMLAACSTAEDGSIIVDPVLAKEVISAVKSEGTGVIRPDTPVTEDIIEERHDENEPDKQIDEKAEPTKAAEPIGSGDKETAPAEADRRELPEKEPETALPEPVPEKTPEDSAVEGPSPSDTLDSKPEAPNPDPVDTAVPEDIPDADDDEPVASTELEILATAKPTEMPQPSATTAPSKTPEPEPTTTPEQKDDGMEVLGSSFNKAVLKAVNEVRAGYGNEPLKLDSGMCRKALAHAKAMARKGKIFHSGLGIETVTDSTESGRSIGIRSAAHSTGLALDADCSRLGVGSVKYKGRQYTCVYSVLD